MDDRQAHILIVDDSEDSRNMFAHYLARRGYRVTTAHDGEDGLEKAFGLLPDLVVLDLWLPKKSGWEVVQRLKAVESTKRIPVVVVTGHSSARALECEGILTKPLVPEQLAAKIAKILRKLGRKRTSSDSPRKAPQQEVTKDSPGCTPAIPDPVSN
jgi:two-component system cell cycle response regulator DivK